MRIRIVAVLGDYYHREEWSVESIKQAVRDHFENDQVVVENISVTELATSLLTKPDAVILFKENRVNPEAEKVETWMDPLTEKIICEYVKNGGSWIAWHSGLASYPTQGDYLSMTRGYFIRHPEIHQLVNYRVSGAKLIDPSYDFAIIDEHYFVHCNEAETNVFLRSESIDGASIAGWAHEYGEGRVVCLTPAHLKEGLLHPNMTRMLAQVIKWGCRLV
ncbi:trehalose utilization [Anaerobacillus alkaliphilus]|uniref:Trehalose utilization n=1 Tax=Anaerobacillus alkaliphilus TaxID=1548597 RepID=A0A4Q0VP65_9BACI|nr:ThuA domain-containing protein [Anaerobacillus alkaliphilus]RXI96662.1 trehalose utilization [Anaerobacillus alkaliphilus]